jgi:hypothetical protein
MWQTNQLSLRMSLRLLYRDLQNILADISSRKPLAIVSTSYEFIFGPLLIYLARQLL